MKHILSLVGVIFLMFFQLSCGSDEEVKTMPETEVPEAEVMDTDQGNYGLPILPKVNLTSMYEAGVRELEENSELQLITVLDGTDKVSIKVKYLGMRDFNFGFPLYEFELTDPLVEKMGGIAQGMSGSPVGPEGRVIGALAYGDSFGTAPYRFWATTIDAMEEARDHRPLGEFMNAPGAPSVHTRWMPIKTPLVVSGINQRRVEDVSKRLRSSRFDAINFVADVGGAPANAPTVSGDLEAGDMIGVAIATGDVVDLTAYGTVTQVYNDGTFVAFGHSFRYDGAVSLPVYQATTAGIVANLQIPYKSVVKYGEPIGTLTKDLSAAVVGELGDPPDMIPISVSYHPVNSDKPIKTESEVAYGQEWAIAPVVAWTVDALRREWTGGTSDGTLVLSFEETKKTYTHRWRNVSPDPFFDTYENLDYAVGEFTDPLKNAAGKATLKSISVEITDKPQLASAEIIDVKVPDNIRTGTQVTFTVVLLPHWSVAEDDERTIEKDISLNIPSDFKTGSVTLKVEAQTTDLFDLIFDFDFDFDLDSDTEDEGPPQTLDELIEERQDRILEPGTIKVTLEANGSLEDIEEELILDDYVVNGEITDSISIE
ncbi:MAG: hypothetical protein OXI43_20525 [Candidatus Poribacteria bacterium]|nr:hypothetical protein [Candidatus Poribacteria bacterium]